MSYRVAGHRRLQAALVRLVTRKATWWQFYVSPDTLHVVPVGDYFSHSYKGCLCQPDTEFTQAPEHGDLWVHKHHSFDKRKQIT
jgi:hypothetical protein